MSAFLELAGPPPGRLPAGMSPIYSQPTNQQSQTMGSPTMTGSGSGTAPSSAGYFPQTGAPSVMSQTQSGPRTSWGDPNIVSRARYDGCESTITPRATEMLTSHATASGKHHVVQADVDSPYPVTARGGVASAFTKYGADKEAVSGIDGRLGWAHKRLREGKV